MPLIKESGTEHGDEPSHARQTKPGVMGSRVARWAHPAANYKIIQKKMGKTREEQSRFGGGVGGVGGATKWEYWWFTGDQKATSLFVVAVGSTGGVLRCI